MPKSLNLASLILEFSKKNPHAPAAWANHSFLTYGTLAHSSRNLANFLQNIPSPAHSPSRLGIFGDRHLDIPVGVIAATWAGFGYVPFSLKAPPSRLEQQLERANCKAMLIDQLGTEYLKSLAPEEQKSLLFHMPEYLIAGDPLTFDFLKENALHPVLLWELEESNLPPAALSGDEESYIIFTSGSTGMPKGVVVPMRARHAYQEEVCRRYPLSPEDKIAQPVDLAWDVSIGNMIFAWANGACLFYLNERQALRPAAFIRKHAITVWQSSPVTADFLLEWGTLQENIFPSLHLSFFIGSPLHSKIATAWKQAAPNTILYNTYGPTEFTIACFDEEILHPENEISIGKPFDKTCCRIAADDPEEEGKRGELWLSGDQLATGYLDDPEKTAEAFPSFNGKRWYRTGDLVEKKENGKIYFKGRLNNQMKVMGYRVELEEIETHLREALNGAPAVVCGWPLGQTCLKFLMAFTTSHSFDEASLKKKLSAVLPSYMIPQHIFKIRNIPLNASGKIDRKALADDIPPDVIKTS